MFLGRALLFRTRLAVRAQYRSESAWIVDELQGQIWRVDLSRREGLPSP